MNNAVITIGLEKFTQYVIKDKLPALVDFSAAWCGPCKQMAPILDTMAKEYGDVNIFKVDVDQSHDLAAEYKITSVPTLIYFKEGKREETMVGGGNAAKIKSTFPSLFTT